jgi:hypothetical protein
MVWAVPGWRLGPAPGGAPAAGRGLAAILRARVRALFSLLVFRLLPENNCSPGFKAV